MAKPFDAATKELLEYDPRGWLELLVRPPAGDVRVLNVDLSTVTAEADSVLAVEEADPWLVHVEIQSTYDPDLALRLQRYNVLVNYRHRWPVRSVALLLCPRADGPALSGLFQQRLPDGLVYHEFRYNVVRLWERPAGEILAGGLGTLPLAPLARVGAEELPEVIGSIRTRLEREATEEQAQTVWTATYLLMGLSYSEELVERLFEGAKNMRESVTYQKILREGRAEGRTEGRAEGRAEGQALGRVQEVKRLLRRLGGRRLGEPSPRIEAAIDNLADLDRLEEIVDRVLDAKSWDELLGQPANGSS